MQENKLINFAFNAWCIRKSDTRVNKQVQKI